MFDKPSQVEQAVRDWRSAASSSKSELCQNVGTDMCMYEGAQWLDAYRDRIDRSVVGSRPVNYSPDSTKLRVTSNRIVRLVQKVQAMTYPARIEMEYAPVAEGAGLDPLETSRVLELVAASAVESSGFQPAAANANFRRCVAGTWGMGLHLRSIKNETGEPDMAVRAFDFSPLQLTLDPFCQKLDLHEHEYVVYTDAMTASAVRSLYGVNLDESRLATIGSLTPMEQSLNAISQNRLFQRYRMHSTTKGVMVHQVHVRDDFGRFPQMWVMIETAADAGMVAVNGEDPSSPYGGDGLPLVLLHGQRRSESMWSLGEARLMRDDQMKLNLVTTQLLRQVQRNTGYQIMLDKRAHKDMEDSEVAAHNTVAGLLWYNGGTKDTPANPPSLMQYPAPQGILQQIIDSMEGSMEQQVHRSDANFGRLKSHVPDASFQRAIEEADQVLGQRISEDLARYSRLIDTMVLTCVRQAQTGMPGVLAQLKLTGFDAEDFTALAAVNPNRPGVTGSVREASVRYRSHESRRKDLGDALTNQAITPKQYRAGQAQKAAASLLRGVPWTPITLGEYTDDFLVAFRRALLDPRARRDPQLAELIQTAILVQQQLAYAEISAAQAASAPPGAGAGGAGGNAQLAQPDDAQAALSELVGILSGVGAPGGGGQPVAA